MLPNLISTPMSALDYDLMLDAVKARNQRLPPQIKEFSVTYDMKDFLPHLPLCLTKLSMAEHAMPLLVELPSTLTEINAFDASWSSVETKFWPSNLITITLTHDPLFAPLDFHRLPRSLKNFYLNRYPWSRETKGPIAESVDSSVFRAAGQAMLAGADNARWMELKSNLPRKWKQVEDYIAAVEDGELGGLPLNLTSFFCGSLNCLDDITLVLPPTMRYLELREQAAMLQTQLLYVLLPPSLESIELLRPTRDCDLSYHDTFATPFLHASKHPLFNLTVLSMIISCRLMDKVQYIVRCLPRTLLHLTLSAYRATLQREDIAQLPPRLLHLDLRCTISSSHQDLDYWTLALPRELKTLQLQPGAIHGKELAKLPSSLECLEAPLDSVTIPHILAMPCRLSQILPLSLKGDALTALEWNTLVTTFAPFHLIRHSSLERIEAIIESSPSPFATRR